MKKYRHKPTDRIFEQHETDSYTIHSRDNGKVMILDIDFVSISNEFEEITEQKYLKPKTDKDRVFSFVKCQRKMHNRGAWYNDRLIGYSKKFECFYLESDGKVNDLDEIRIPMFSPENPPPVDTLVEWCSELFYYACFNENKVKFNSYPSTDRARSIHYGLIKDTEFTGFEESDYEEY